MQTQATKEAKAGAKRLRSSVPGRSGGRASRRCSRQAPSATESAVSLGMSLMGRSVTALPDITTTATSFTLSRDKSLPIGFLKTLTESGSLRSLIPSLMPTGPEELLINIFNRWLEPRSRKIDRWVGLDISLSLGIDHAVLRLTPTDPGYFPAIDRCYDALAAKNPALAHAFYSLIHHSLKTLGLIYDLDAAQEYKGRCDEMREEDEAYAAARETPTDSAFGAQEDASHLNFDKIPKPLFEPLSFEKSLRIVGAEHSAHPSPLFHALIRLAKASRNVLKPRLAWRWTSDVPEDLDDYDDQDGSDLPLILFPFAGHSVIEQAFDEETEYWMQTGFRSLVRMVYERRMNAKQLTSTLAALRHWLHGITLTIALAKQVQKVQPPPQQY